MDDNEQDVEKLNEILNEHKIKTFEEEFCTFLDSNQYSEEDVFIDDDFDTDIDEFDTDSPNVLTEDETRIINSCTDYDLRQILELNRIKNFKLVKLRAYIDNLIENCDEMIRQNQEEILTINNKQQINTDSVKLLPPIKIPIWKLGAPYFKCQNYYFSPYNEDVRRKRSNNELLLDDYLYESKAWTKLDCQNLLDGVLFYYNTNRQIQIKKEIDNLKQMIQDDADNVDLLTKLLRFEEELERLNSQKPKESGDELPILPKSDDYIDWNKIAETFFYDKKTAKECGAFWHIYGHPCINKKSWSKEENIKLRKLVKSHNYQNWQMIAIELNTNRTAFTSALHFYRDLYNKFIRRKFSYNEDQLLLELVDLYRMGDFISWRKISEYFPNRSRQQLYHHYRYYLSMNESIKKGKFTDAEDILLLILVDRYGTDFRKCSKFIEHRSQVQLKSRYRQNLENYKRKGTFTINDDIEILKHVKEFGESKWGALSIKLNRTRGTVRQRYQTIKQYLKTNRDASIEDIPKRKHGELMKSNQQHYEFVRYVADKFKNSQIIPTLEMIEKFLKNDSNSDEDDGLIADKKVKSQKNYQQSIDGMLVDFFTNSCTLKQTKYTNKNFDKITKDISAILTILNVNLEIPENLDDLRLDRSDKIILNQLKSTIIESHENYLIPPNINTLIGLRSLLLRHQLLEKPNDNQILLEIEQDLLQHIDEREQILSNRRQFSDNFNKLFLWSSILSLEPPPNDCDSDESAPPKRRRLENMKTYSRRGNKS